MEFTKEEKETFNEILSLPEGVIKDAIHWWNKDATQATKRLIVVSAYYETILLDAEKTLENIDFFEGLQEGDSL